MKTSLIYSSDDGVASLRASVFEEPAPIERPWTPKRRPAILVIPGGGYSVCTEREADPVALTFNMAGYQAFLLRYHIGAASAYPTPLVEAATALAYIREHSEAYHVDPDRIAVIGFSAGGHLAALLGSSWHRTPVQDLTGLPAEAMRPNAVLLGYPLVNLKAFVERRPHDPYVSGVAVGAMFETYVPAADPLALVSEQTPPTYIHHTLGDQVLLPAETIEYVVTLLRHGVSCEYHLFSEGPHGLVTADGLTCYGRDYPPRVHAWVPMAVAWLNALFRYDF